MTTTEVTTILRQFNAWSRDERNYLTYSEAVICEAIDAAVEMIERLEAAESDCLEQALLLGMSSSREAALMAKLEAAEKERDALRAENEALATNLRGKHSITGATYAHLIAERDALRAKIEQMEKQGPVGQFIQHPSNGLWEQDGYGDNPDARPLYALPGVKGE